MKWLLIVGIIILFSDCTQVPMSIPDKTYELVEPLGTKHLYRKEPLVDKSYYCLIHEAPEIIWESEGSKRVRRYSGPKWGSY